MAGWAGFTDEDLRRMKQGPDNGTASIRQSQLKRQRPPNRERLSQNSKSRSGNGQTNMHDVLEPSQRLTVPDGAKLSTSDTKQRSNTRQEDVDLSEQEKNDPNKEKTSELISKDGDSVSGNSKVQENEEKLARELDEVEAISVEMDNVARFQKQQKMIEEANKQKKEFLAKAISERRKKAKAESVKLGKIQSELSHLDSLLSVDVNMIRDKIEKASFDYMDAQKRYARAEEEFINAKMALFEKGELKEKLTEHLYTIIHQNEVRKSKKLAELMKQLEMEVAKDEEEEMAVPVIPMLTNFNSVTTLHDPKSPVHSPDVGKIVNLSENKNAGSEDTGPEDQKVSVDSESSVDVKTPSDETNNNELQSGVDNSCEKSEKTDTSRTEADNDVTSASKCSKDVQVTEEKVSDNNKLNESISDGNSANEPTSKDPE